MAEPLTAADVADPLRDTLVRQWEVRRVKFKKDPFGDPVVDVETTDGRWWRLDIAALDEG